MCQAFYLEARQGEKADRMYGLDVVCSNRYLGDDLLNSLLENEVNSCLKN